MAIQRQTAIPCSVRELREGAWLDGTPSGVVIPRGFVGRANLIGLCVGSDEGTVMLDDGTGVIRARRGERSLAQARVGAPALVIGIPREYDGERYLDLEIAKPVAKEWIAYRKRELAAPVAEERIVRSKPTPVPVHSPVTQPAVLEKPKNPLLRILDLIREMDDGSGAQLDDVITRAGVADAQRLVRTLLEEGEIFEVRPGRVKVLE